MFARVLPFATASFSTRPGGLRSAHQMAATSAVQTAKASQKKRVLLFTGRFYVSIEGLPIPFDADKQRDEHEHRDGPQLRPDL
jgi:hypothetical protein